MPKNVLIVQNSYMMRRLVQKHLHRMEVKFTAIEAGDGIDALNFYKSGGIDIVLTDWDMPNMNGIDLIRELRKLDPEKKLPIIMVTCEATMEKVKEAFLVGVNDYLIKPFTGESFKSKLEPFFGSTV